MGTMVTIMERQSMAWRHWGKSSSSKPRLQFHVAIITHAHYHLSILGCVTPAILRNIKDKLNGPDDIDGYEDLRPEDQEKVQKAWEEGHGEYFCLSNAMINLGAFWSIGIEGNTFFTDFSMTNHHYP